MSSSLIRDAPEISDALGATAGVSGIGLAVVDESIIIGMYGVALLLSTYRNRRLRHRLT